MKKPIDNFLEYIKTKGTEGLDCKEDYERDFNRYFKKQSKREVSRYSDAVNSAKKKDRCKFSPSMKSL